MPAQEVEQWLSSRKSCTINGVALKPRRHPLLTSIPFSISRGQAEAFYLADGAGAEWILKKFHRGRTPDGAYLSAISACVPPLPNFLSGHQRKVITAPDPGSRYATHALVAWLRDTVLMPRVSGADWSTLADGLRDGTVRLNNDQRAMLCADLAQCIDVLEQTGCAHRDLSCGNIYIDKESSLVSLIDWDSMYHRQLRMPANTTAGSQGYIAPFLFHGQEIDGAATWSPLADRFALAVCCAEFLCMDDRAALHGDGGMFDQVDIQHRDGLSLRAPRAALRSTNPEAACLFERALTACQYDECPAPSEWRDLARTSGRIVTLDTTPLAWPSEAALAVHLVQTHPPAPVWAAPSLADLPALDPAAIPTREVDPVWAAPSLADLPAVDDLAMSMPGSNQQPSYSAAPPLPNDPWSPL